MTWIESLFSKLEGFFTSPKAKAVEQEILTLLPFALTIVQDIAKAVPNTGTATAAQVLKVADTYGVPLDTAVIEDNKTSIGNALLNIASGALKAAHAPTASTSTLNTVVQLALTAAGLATP